jgi:hypothetical protein
MQNSHWRRIKKLGICMPGKLTSKLPENRTVKSWPGKKRKPELTMVNLRVS